MKTLDEFADHYFEQSKLALVTSDQLEDLRQLGHTVEQLLDRMAEKYNLLFHGSSASIETINVNEDHDGTACYTAKSAIAMISALYDKKIILPGGINLSYPTSISDDSPLVLEIEITVDPKILKNASLLEHHPELKRFVHLSLREIGLSSFDRIIQQKGFVYTVTRDDEFKQHPQYDWEVNTRKDRKPIGKFEIVQDDFKYQVNLRIFAPIYESPIKE